MKKISKLFVIYFSVILVSLQVFANIISILYSPLYDYTGFYVNCFIGTNILFSLFLISFSYMFKFCAVSRYASIAELLFGINYLLVKEDNLYNVLFQITVGIAALALTAKYYMRKFPNCSLSMVKVFLKKLVKTGKCETALDEWVADKKVYIKKQIETGKDVNTIKLKTYDHTNNI